jgi:CRP-like cAMP-binding protein
MTHEELRSVPLFRDISDAGLDRLAACVGEIDCEPGQVLALPGDPGSGMFVILDGRVSVETRGGRFELGPGDFFGEIALLRPDIERVGRVRAATHVRCLGIPREDAIALVESEHALTLVMLRELARRLADAVVE